MFISSRILKIVSFIELVLGIGILLFAVLLIVTDLGAPVLFGKPVSGFGTVHGLQFYLPLVLWMTLSGVLLKKVPWLGILMLVVNLVLIFLFIEAVLVAFHVRN